MKETAKDERDRMKDEKDRIKDCKGTLNVTNRILGTKGQVSQDL